MSQAPAFRQVLIANRGEIALRAVKVLRRLGIGSVAVYSTADSASAHVLAADRSVCIGPPAAQASYLCADALIHVALRTGCDAVYPGYGFLAENAAFAARCAENGLKFIGPSAEVIGSMGDKSLARERAVALGIPVVPGSKRAFTNPGEASLAASDIGFPLLLKARSGGGGRGMRIVENLESFSSAFSQASREAESAFGDGAVYLERFFGRVRHIEVQVLGDGRGEALAFHERDCSVQRRHQKLLEETPSPVVDQGLREALLESAVRLAAGLDYEGAGTVEFILEPESGEFFFIEMNTRIQVEHPVTEARAAIDLVEAQFRIAAGAALAEFDRREAQRGHAIEFRINAEDWRRDFQPAPGEISVWQPPCGEGLRLDSAMARGQRVTPFYDSMIAKLIVHGEDRQDALRLARGALAAFRCEGVATTIDFHRLLIEQEDFRNNRVHTRWIENEMFGAERSA